MLTIKDSKFDEKSVHHSPKITFDFIVRNTLVVWLLLRVILIRIGGSISYKAASSATCLVSVIFVLIMCGVLASLSLSLALSPSFALSVLTFLGLASFSFSLTLFLDVDLSLTLSFIIFILGDLDKDFVGLPWFVSGFLNICLSLSLSCFGVLWGLGVLFLTV